MVGRFFYFAETPNKEANEDDVNHKVKAYYRLSSINQIMFTTGILKVISAIGGILMYRKG